MCKVLYHEKDNKYMSWETAKKVLTSISNIQVK